MRNTIEADEEMLYSDKEIHFDESLTIEGRAVFENCKIYCCENGNGSNIEIEEDGEVQFINCEITFCGIGVSKKKNHEFWFINSDNGSMTIKDCKLYYLHNFATGSFNELEVSGSEFINCMSGIFSTDTDNLGIVKDCRFLSRKLPDFLKAEDEDEDEDVDENDEDEYEDEDEDEDEEIYSNKALLKKVSGPLIEGYYEISDCTFEFGTKVNIYALEIDNTSSASNCTFINDESVPVERLEDYTTCIHCRFNTL